MIRIILLALALVVSFIFAIFVNHLFWLLFAICFIVAIGWFAVGFYTIHQDQRALLERNGVYEETVGPGRHWRVTWVDEVRDIIGIGDMALNLNVAKRKVTLGGTISQIDGATAFLRLINPQDISYVDDEGREGDPVYRAGYYCDGKLPDTCIALLEKMLSTVQVGTFPAGFLWGHPTNVIEISAEASARLRRWGVTGYIVANILPN